jgi:hypothetical protein
MIALGGQRFVGVSQADETRRERSKRVNHAIKQEDRALFNLHSQGEGASATALAASSSSSIRRNAQRTEEAGN